MTIFRRLGYRSSYNNKDSISSVSNVRSSAAKSYGSNGKGALSYGEYGFNPGHCHPKSGVASYQRSSIRGKLCKRLYKRGPYKRSYRGSSTGKPPRYHRGIQGASDPFVVPPCTAP